jgi:hypothetical protein
MRARSLLAAGAAVVLGSVGTVLPVLEETAGQQMPAPAHELRPPSAFDLIVDQRERAVALFQEAAKVLQHPRCVNCHPATERPRQTDAMHPHQPLVVRGADGHGAPGMTCATCHHAGNYDPARVPGDPHWHLAPASMAWEGRSVGQICEQVKDPARNGNRNIAAILDHVVTDSLVIWAWSPGPGRTPAPGTNAEFGALLRAWANAGAHCPSP